jgi:hypothetical protein
MFEDVFEGIKILIKLLDENRSLSLFIMIGTILTITITVCIIRFIKFQKLRN